MMATVAMRRPDWPVTVLPYGGGKRWLERGVDDLLDLAESDLNNRHTRVCRVRAAPSVRSSAWQVAASG
jgi:hypothetical protein